MHVLCIHTQVNETDSLKQQLSAVESQKKEVCANSSAPTYTASLTAHLLLLLLIIGNNKIGAGEQETDTRKR